MIAVVVVAHAGVRSRCRASWTRSARAGARTPSRRCRRCSRRRSGGAATAPATPHALANTAESRQSGRTVWGCRRPRPTGYYTMRCRASSATGYTVTATAVAGTSQAPTATASVLRVRVAGGNMHYGSGCRRRPPSTPTPTAAGPMNARTRRAAVGLHADRVDGRRGRGRRHARAGGAVVPRTHRDAAAAQHQRAVGDRPAVRARRSSQPPEARGAKLGVTGGCPSAKLLHHLHMQRCRISMQSLQLHCVRRKPPAAPMPRPQEIRTVVVPGSDRRGSRATACPMGSTTGGPLRPATGGVRSWRSSLSMAHGQVPWTGAVDTRSLRRCADHAAHDDRSFGPTSVLRPARAVSGVSARHARRTEINRQAPARLVAGRIDGGHRRRPVHRGRHRDAGHRQLSENRRVLLETQVQQDLRAAADIIARDLRRAGRQSDNDALLNVAQPQPAAPAGGEPLGGQSMSARAAAAT